MGSSFAFITSSITSSAIDPLSLYYNLSNFANSLSFTLYISSYTADISSFAAGSSAAPFGVGSSFVCITSSSAIEPLSLYYNLSSFAKSLSFTL